jgi:hypothetical protein
MNHVLYDLFVFASHFVLTTAWWGKSLFSFLQKWGWDPDWRSKGQVWGSFLPRGQDLPCLCILLLLCPRGKDLENHGLSDHPLVMGCGLLDKTLPEKPCCSQKGSRRPWDRGEGLGFRVRQGSFNSQLCPSLNGACAILPILWASSNTKKGNLVLKS